MNAGEMIDKICKNKSDIISYIALPSEVDPACLFPLPAIAYQVPTTARSSPENEARYAIAAARAPEAAVFLPGKQFDALGTRHGRGGGWYDRFLAAVPSSWVRIGFCTESQFSETPLFRQPWDQPVDYVVIAGDQIVLHETHARDLVS